MNIALTAANISKWIAWGTVRVTSLHGMNNQGTTVYIQLHEVPPKADGTLAAGTVPSVKSLQCAANSPFMFNVDFTLKELFLALSTTEANYTAVAAAGGLDMTVVVSGGFLCDGTEVVVGDTTSIIDNLQLWAEAAGPKKLLRLDVTELLGLAQFIAVEPTDADANVPWDKLTPLAVGATVNCNYGTSGLDVFSKSVNQTLRKGCTIRVVLAPPTFPWAAGGAAIRAIYKA